MPLFYIGALILYYIHGTGIRASYKQIFHEIIKMKPQTSTEHLSNYGKVCTHGFVL